MLINGHTELIAHIGYPTHSFKAPMANGGPTTVKLSGSAKFSHQTYPFADTQADSNPH